MIQTNTKQTPMPGQIELSNDAFSPYESACMLYLRSAFELAPFAQTNDPDAIAVLKHNAETVRRFRFLQVTDNT